MVRPLIAAILFAAILPAQTTLPPTPRPYTALYVFGDSYSDIGAGYPSADGPTAVAYLAQHLAIPFTYYGAPNGIGKSLDFAVGGAKSGADLGGFRAPLISFRLGIRNQVEEFATLLHSGQINFDPATTMFFLAGGLNDRDQSNGYTRANLEQDIDALYSLGARRFMVALLPTKIHAFATAGTRFNPEIASIPADERARHPDIRIANSNWGTFFDEVITHPATYGITDTTTACAHDPAPSKDPNACTNPAVHFYYYAAHPSTAAHRAVGDMLYHEALTNSP